MTGLLL